MMTPPNHAQQRLPAILCLASLVTFSVLAAGEPKVPRTPAPLRDVLGALKPGMSGAEAKAVVATAYPKVRASLVRSGTNGYIWFHVDERYSVMISAQNPSSGDPSASSVILGPNVRAYYLTDRERKRATLTPR